MPKTRKSREHSRNRINNPCAPHPRHGRNYFKVYRSPNTHGRRWDSTRPSENSFTAVASPVVPPAVASATVESPPVAEIHVDQQQRFGASAVNSGASVSSVADNSYVYSPHFPGEDNSTISSKEGNFSAEPEQEEPSETETVVDRAIDRTSVHRKGRLTVYLSESSDSESEEELTVIGGEVIGHPALISYSQDPAPEPESDTEENSVVFVKVVRPEPEPEEEEEEEEDLAAATDEPEIPVIRATDSVTDSSSEQQSAEFAAERIEPFGERVALAVLYCPHGEVLDRIPIPYKPGEQNTVILKWKH